MARTHRVPCVYCGKHFGYGAGVARHEKKCKNAKLHRSYWDGTRWRTARTKNAARKLGTKAMIDELKRR